MERERLLERPFSSILEGAANAAIGFAAADILALIAVGLAEAVGDLHLDQSLLEIHLERDQRAALAAEPLPELEDLLFVHKQLASSKRIFIEYVPVRIRADMHPADKQFPVFDRAEGIFQIDISRPNRFYFRTGQFDAGFIAFQYKVFVKCFTI